MSYIKETLVHEHEQALDDIEDLELENKRLRELVKVADCPACDASTSEHQCQWCKERAELLDTRCPWEEDDE